MSTLELPLVPTRQHTRIVHHPGWYWLKGQNGWVEYDVDFQTASDTVTVALAMQLNAAEPRPVQLLARASATEPWLPLGSVAANTTGTWWDRNRMQWFEQGTVVVPCAHGRSTRHGSRKPTSTDRSH